MGGGGNKNAFMPLVTLLLELVHKYKDEEKEEVIFMEDFGMEVELELQIMHQSICIKKWLGIWIH